MEKVDEDIEELEIRSVRDEEAHVEQERLVVLPEVLPLAWLAYLAWLARIPRMVGSLARMARWLALCQDPNECMRYNIQMNLTAY